METTLEPTRFDWPANGAEFNDTEDKQRELKLAAEKIEWEELSEGKRLPFSQGYAIMAALKQLPLRGATHAGWAHHDQGQLIGIRKMFSNATIEFHALDTGLELIPVVISVWENNQAKPASGDS